MNLKQAIEKGAEEFAVRSGDRILNFGELERLSSDKLANCSVSLRGSPLHINLMESAHYDREQKRYLTQPVCSYRGLSVFCRVDDARSGENIPAVEFLSEAYLFIIEEYYHQDQSPPSWRVD